MGFRYPVISPNLIMKYGAFNTSRYFVKDLKTKRFGTANNDAYILFLLCDGTRSVEEIVNVVAEKYETAVSDVDFKVRKTLDYYENMGFLSYGGSLVSSPVHPIVRTNSMPWSLDTVYLEVTHACNVRCIHCYTNAGDRLSHELSTKQFFDIIDQLAGLGVLFINVTGGEPLMRRDVFEIMEHVVDNHLFLNVFTNGVLLDKERVERLRMLDPECVAVSIDGATVRTHDRIRGVPCFDMVLQNIRLLVDAKVRVRTNTCVYTENVGEIGELVDLLRGMGVGQILLDTFVGVGRGSSHAELQLSPTVAADITRVIAEKNKSFIDAGKKVPELTFSETPVASEFRSTGDKKYSYCGVGTSSCTIRPNGDMVLCPMLSEDKYCAGNVLDTSIEKLWVDSSVFEPLRNHSVEDIIECKACEQRVSCAGGCKAKALFFNGKFCSRDLWMCASHS
ncbi:MAG: radical SAM protein [Methanobacteriota archaeon]